MCMCLMVSGCWHIGVTCLLDFLSFAVAVTQLGKIFPFAPLPQTRMRALRLNGFDGLPLMYSPVEQR